MISCKHQIKVGILCHIFEKHGSFSDLDLRELPLRKLEQGESVFEQSIVALRNVCEQVYFCVDQELYNDSDFLIDLISFYDVTLIIKSNLTPYLAIAEVCSKINKDELILFNQLGSVLDLDGIFSSSLKNVISRLDQPCIFGEEYCGKKSFGLPKLRRNLKSVALTDSSEPAFVSASGEFIVWSGLIMIRVSAFEELATDIMESEILREFKYEEFGHAVPVSASALDLSLILGAPSYSLEPFYLCIGGIKTNNYLNISSQILDNTFYITK